MPTTPETPPVGPSGFTNFELGYPKPPPPPPGNLPPGGGRYSVPSFLDFSALVQYASRSFGSRFDEAMRDSPTNARAMRRDASVMRLMWSRKRPTALLTWNLEPHDESDPAEAEAAKLITEIIEAIPRFQKMKMCLLEALWFGRYAVELVYGYERWYGRTVTTVRNFIPINGDKLRFKWDGTPGVLVGGMYPGTAEATDWGLCHFLTDPREREQYIIHEFEPDDPDWTEAEMAGAIHGVGIRGKLYWVWWMKQQIFGLLMNYLERFANGLTIFYYAAHDPAAKAEAEAAASQQFSNTALLYPRWNTENPDVNKVERLEVGTASPALLQNLITTYFDDIFREFILGQTLSGTAESTGMGSGLAELHGDTLDEIIKYDAVDLSETLQRDLVEVLYRHNAPGVRAGKFSFQVDAPNSEEVMKYAQMLFEMGVPLDEDTLYDLSQMPKPKPGGGIVTQMGAMQPAAVGGVPGGMPVAGQVGQPGMNGAPPPQMNGQMAAYKRNGVAKGNGKLIRPPERVQTVRRLPKRMMRAS